MQVFCDASDFDSSLDGFEASSDDDDNVDEWKNLLFKSRQTIFL